MWIFKLLKYFYLRKEFSKDFTIKSKVKYFSSIYTLSIKTCMILLLDTIFILNKIIGIF